MTNIKILENFEPYNDFGYTSCFYHSFFPILIYYDKNINTFLSSNVYSYDYKLEDNYLNMGIYSITEAKFEDNLRLSEMGVNIKRDIKCLVKELVMSINMSNPVILVVDSFFSPSRQDVYKKQHLIHYITVYGYDKIRKIFHIIENKSVSSLLYEKRTICFKDLINCYNGGLSLLEKEDRKEAYLEFHLLNNTNIECINNKSFYKNRFINYYMDNEKKLLAGQKSLDLFIQHMKIVLQKEEEIEKYASDIIDIIKNIITYKKVEKYSKLIVLEVDNSFTLLDEIVLTNWNFVRALLGRYLYSNKYILRSIEEIIKRIEENGKLERQIHKNITILHNTKLVRNYE